MTATTTAKRRRQRVLVVVRRPLDQPRAAQGLRAAVGYLTVGLEVTVALCGAAARDFAARADAPATLPLPVMRHLLTLESLAARLVAVDEVDLCALLSAAAEARPGELPAAVVVW